MHSLTQGVRAELAGQGTFVAGVYPGPVDTDMAASVDMDKTAPEAVVREVLREIDAGEIEIYPDPFASELHSGLLNDPKEVEAQAAQMLPN